LAGNEGSSPSPPHMRLSLDFETRSTVDLRRTGVYPYAQDPTTAPWCMAYAFGEEEPELWVPGDPFPERIGDQIRDLEFHAWNANFERVFWGLVMTPRYAWPRPEREQFFDTAAAGAAMALPRKLADAARVLGIEEQIHEDKHGLILRMAKPRKVHGNGRIEWWDVPDRLEQLYEACKQDVRTERAAGDVIRPLSKMERQVYLLDQVVNDRGVQLDRDLIDAAQRVVDQGTRRANAELSRITDGAVQAVTNTGDLREYLGLDSVAKDVVRDLLEGDEELDPVHRQILQIRQDAGKSSTAKLGSMVRYACSDWRARGMLLYHGAGTGRWSGKGPQPQNYPRPEVKDVERFISLVLAGDYDAIAAEEPPMVVVSSLLRSMFVARSGHRLMAGDFAQMEARVLAWIAGQDDLLQAFATGAKIYEEMGAAYSGKPLEEITKDSDERQVGKNSYLGAGFQMGADTFAAQVQKQTGIVLPRGERGENGELLPGEVDVAQLVIDLYRGRVPRIRQFWYDIQDAVFDAVVNPGLIQTVGRRNAIRYTVRGQFLWCQLPSGRFLAYARPAIRERKTPWGETKPAVTFEGVDSYTRRWKRMAGYGGLWTENVVQAMARDLIATAMLRVERAGYRVVLSVHDEVVAEPRNGHGSLEEFLALMETRPRWAEDLPVAAEGWEGERYRK